MVKVLLATSLVAMIALPATAFSGPEHIAVSNLALRIAIERAEELGKLTPADAEELRQWTLAKDCTFGDIVALVDQIKDIAPIFDQPLHQDLTTYSSINCAYLQRLRRQYTRSLQAKSLNENHFQNLALATHLVHHRAAVSEARNGHLVRALLLEAFALHHIEDFLSPGHVATARSGTADFVAIGLHDKYTDRGLDFRFDDDFQLLELADFATAHKNLTEETLHLDASAFKSLATAMRSGSKEHFLGDSHLHRSRIQAAFVTIVAARSIVEVLHEDGDAFAKYCFKWGRNAGCESGARGLGMLQAARIVGGGYEAMVRPLQFFIPGEILFVTLENAVNPDDLATDFEGGPVGKRFVEFEAVLAAVPQSSGLPIAPALLAGYARRVGPGQAGRSAHVRLIIPIPRTNLQISGTRSIDLDRRSRDSYGGALEAGFGFLFVRFGLQQDRNTLLGGRVNTARAYTFGVSGVIPGRTVLHKASSLMRN